MSLHLTIDPKRRWVILVAEGSVTPADAERAFDEIVRNHALSYSKLVDVSKGFKRATPAKLLEVAGSIRVAHAIHCLKNKRIGPLAVVAHPATGVDMGRLWGIVAVADRPMRLFKTRAAAQRWLRKQTEVEVSEVSPGNPAAVAPANH